MEVHLQVMRFVRHACLLPIAREALGPAAIDALAEGVPAHSQHKRAMVESMSAMCNLCCDHDENRRRLVQAGMHVHVLECMSRWQADFEAVLVACRVVQVSVQGVEPPPYHALTPSVACAQGLAVEGANHADLADADVGTHLVRVVRASADRLDHVAILDAALQALRNLAACTTTAVTLVSCDVIPCVVDVLGAYMGNEPVASRALAVLANVARVPSAKGTVAGVALSKSLTLLQEHGASVLVVGEVLRLVRGRTFLSHAVPYLTDTHANSTVETYFVCRTVPGRRVPTPWRDHSCSAKVLCWLRWDGPKHRAITSYASCAPPATAEMWACRKTRSQLLATLQAAVNFERAAWLWAEWTWPTKPWHDTRRR